jgi:hypothetical protein
MNVEQINAVFSTDANETIVKSELSKTQSFLLLGGSGLKKGETLLIPAQKIRLDTFDLPTGKTDPTLCVAAIVTSKLGTERVIKMSLGSLKRRSYGTEQKVIAEGTFPQVDVNQLELVTKYNEDTETAELLTDVKLKVADVKIHYFGKFDNKKPMVENGLIVTEGKNTPMLQQIK